MWKRLARLLVSIFNVYSFYQNPVRYIISLLAILLVPYLVYIFWGALLILFFMGLGIYLLYRVITKKWNHRYT